MANCKEMENEFGKIFSRKPMQNKETQQLVQEGKILSIYDAGVKNISGSILINNKDPGEASWVFF